MNFLQKFFTLTLLSDLKSFLSLNVTERNNLMRCNILFKVAEWTDEAGFQAIAAKYIRLRPHLEIEKNRTYIVTTIVVRN